MKALLVELSRSRWGHTRRLQCIFEDFRTVRPRLGFHQIRYLICLVRSGWICVKRSLRGNFDSPVKGQRVFGPRRQVKSTTQCRSRLQNNTVKSQYSTRLKYINIPSPTSTSECQECLKLTRKIPELAGQTSQRRRSVGRRNLCTRLLRLLPLATQRGREGHPLIAGLVVQSSSASVDVSKCPGSKRRTATCSQHLASQLCLCECVNERQSVNALVQKRNVTVVRLPNFKRRERRVDADSVILERPVYFYK